MKSANVIEKPHPKLLPEHTENQGAMYMNNNVALAK